MSAIVTSKETVANEASRILFIREAEIIKITPTKESRFRLKIVAGNKKQKTEVVKIDKVGDLPKWTVNISLDDNPQTRILWELYSRQRPVISRFKVLGSVEKTLGEFFEEGSASADIHLSNGSSEVAVLKVSLQLDTPMKVAEKVVQSGAEPSQTPKLLDNSETFKQVFEAVKQMIDTLAGAHPAATIAWGFLSIGFEVLQSQRDAEQAVLDLYADMISVYEEASKDHILQQRDGLRGTYSSLFKQTIECAIFIEGYAKKSGIGRLFTMDISGQAEKFRQAFVDLKDQLTRGFARESAIVTLGVQELVNVQIMRDRLRDLQPPEELGPKSSCTQGTRVETINTMVLWITERNGQMMWCKGLAGTGKSSLMGTLHDLLTADIGGRSRLAAFVRYDHIQYSNASKLITSIAYALGTFDVRIGMTISKVIETSRSVMTMTDLSRQFQLLLRGPLERVPDLVDEGPLVVIIDGLDECNPSSELLAVLAEGFGPKLPFIRLIVSSRPVHRIATAFEGRDCVYPLHLDTSSKSVNLDIQFYLEQQFATICDDAFQEKCKELDAVSELAARASGLFIWAATIAKFVCGWPGSSRLEAVLATDIPHDATAALTTLYHTALDTLVSQIDSQATNADIKKCVHGVLGAVLVTQMPPGMTEDVLDNVVLLGEGSPSSHHIVSMLGSVLSPETKDSPIQLIHKSLDDFLQDRSRCGDEWFIDAALHRMAIAKQCRVASKSFMKTWSPTSDMDIGAIPAYISKYALFGVFWYSASDKSDIELFTSFFRHYFLPSLDVVATDDNIIHFEVMDTFCRQQGLTRMSFEVDIRDSGTIHHVLQSSPAFYSHLHSSKETPLAGKVTLECIKLGRTEEGWGPTGNNLNIDGVIFVDADGETEYGFKIANTILVPLYVSMFIFNGRDVSIDAIYQPSEEDAPLSPGESLTIGYGTRQVGAAGPSAFEVAEGQVVDVGFSKLFFSTEYLDLSAIPQESPFEGNCQSAPPLKIPSSCHTTCVPIVQKWVEGAQRGFGGRLQF
ncbi:hypothetical protein EV421DRAFT_1906793 [Armillaria borealis]|uniref:Nephrocystin 3-like N-terminal domain-containing protein n=1 Tax=Armillaria borealis TaxID=47425 RepID=A0AA39MLG4_9AGAR|nr:hypothetical protein EV421DRAFT_1906793 [Armillaria borealis]